MTNWVIDLSASTVGVMRVDGRQVLGWHEINMPHEVYRPGFVVDPASAGGFLKQQIRDGKLSIKEPTIVLGPSAAVEMQISIPSSIRSKDLPGVVKSAVARTLSAPLTDIEVYWTLAKKGSLSLKIYVAAIRKNALEGAKKMCEHAGVKPGRILPYFLAMRNLLSATEGVLICSVPGEQTTVLGTEYDAPSITGSVNRQMLLPGNESMLAASLNSILSNAGEGSQLTSNPRVWVIADQEQLAEAVANAGYQVDLLGEPVDWQNQYSWPRLAVAWGAAKTRKGPTQRVDLMKAPGYDAYSSDRIAVAGFAALVVLITSGYAGMKLFVWPSQTRDVESLVQMAQEANQAMTKNKQQMDTLEFLRTQNAATEAQNRLLGDKPMDWYALFTNVMKVKPQNVVIESINADGIPDPAKMAADGAKKADQAAVGGAPASTANKTPEQLQKEAEELVARQSKEAEAARLAKEQEHNPSVTISAIGPIEQLEQFMKALQTNPFSEPQLGNAKVSLNQPAASLPPTTAAPVTGAQPGTQLGAHPGAQPGAHTGAQPGAAVLIPSTMFNFQIRVTYHRPEIPRDNAQDGQKGAPNGGKAN